MPLGKAASFEFGLEGGSSEPKLPTMEEAEVPLEHLHEEIQHHAEHGGGPMDFVGGIKHGDTGRAGSDRRIAFRQSG